MGKTAVIIPVYNEAARLSVVLTNLLSAGRNWDIVVVDDGSDDGSIATVDDYSVHVLQHAINRGQGAALKTGTEYALQNDYDIIAHFDADGQHRVEDLIKLTETIERGKAVIVFGSRFLDAESDIPVLKKVILFAARVFVRQILGLPFTDPQSGLRAFQRDAYERIKWEKDNFEHCTEILNNVHRNKVAFMEIPVKINYDDYAQNKTVKPSVMMGVKILLSRIFRDI